MEWMFWTVWGFLWGLTAGWIVWGRMLRCRQVEVDDG